MTEKPPHIGIDIDGVLFRWDAAAATVLEQTFGYKGLPRESERWNQLQGLVSEEHFSWLFSKEGVEASLSAPDCCYPGVTEGLRRIAEVGVVHFITHRSSAAASVTARWLAEHDCPFQSLNMVGGTDGNHTPKSLVQPECEVYIEDNASNVRELLRNTNALVLMPRMPYNKDLHALADAPYSTSSLRIYNTFDEAVEWFINYARPI